MAAEKVLIPDLGDVDKVDVVEVLVAVGDRVAVDDPLITLESDKASMDVPSPRAGKVVEVKVKKGDQVGEGALILTLEAEAADGEGAGEAVANGESRAAKPDSGAAAPSRGDALTAAAEGGERAADRQAGPAADSPDQASPAAPAATVASAGAAAATRPAGLVAVPAAEGAAPAKAYASPAVRRFARELGVDLGRVRGSGRKGRILKEDVQGFVKTALTAPAAAGATALPPMPVIDFSKFGEVERQPLSRIQRVSLANLHRSWLHVAHVTQHDEADVTEMEAFRKANADKAKAEGFKLTPLAFVMKAVVGALKEYPRVNSSLDPDGEHVLLKRYYHLGIAVDTADGLVVPVIRDVDRKGVFELARELAVVSARAREKKLTPDLLQGASFTITSLGGIGGTAFTPIVNAPEVAILGLSRSRWQPSWNGEKFVPRLMMPVSLSYDHRVIDGALAVRFTTYLCSLLADLRRLVL